MIKSQIMKVSVLSVAFVVVAFFSMAPAKAALWQENCYTSAHLDLDRCTCSRYECYQAGTEQWNGGYLPSSGSWTRSGLSCSNGSGWTTGGGSWGDLGYCYYN